MLRRILRFLRGRPADVEDILRYPDGKRIYREFHQLRREQMDQDALKVINRLNRHGYRSYLVGGCVRDMILGRKPKDFDVVTSATPQQIRKVFTNSRSIGRRFKIVHVVFQGGKIIEVSTFRSLPAHRFDPDEADDYMLKRDNQYGGPREDAARRDFTINALFFDARNESLIDYVGGYEDIQQGRIAVIGDADISFKEDPVRMLRAAKFAALLGFEIENNTLKAIKRNRNEIAKASPARLYEEYNKIFRTGRASAVFHSLADTGLLKSMMPEAFNASELAKGRLFAESALGKRLIVADRMLTEREDLTTTIYLALLMTDLVRDVFTDHVKGPIIDYVRHGIEPLARRLQTPGKDVDRLIQIFMSQPRFWQQGKAGRSRRGRRGGGHEPDMFREKVFFFEAFMTFKINAIAQEHDESIQKAMFWEIGPRPRPPESGKVVSLYPNYRKQRGRGGPGGRDRDRGRGERSERGGRTERSERAPRTEDNAATRSGEGLAPDAGDAASLDSGERAERPERSGRRGRRGRRGRGGNREGARAGGVGEASAPEEESGLPLEADDRGGDGRETPDSSYAEDIEDIDGGMDEGADEAEDRAGAAEYEDDADSAEDDELDDDYADEDAGVDDADDDEAAEPVRRDRG